MAQNPKISRTRRHQKHREMVMRRDHGVCHLCGGPAADAIDHIVPVAWGGSDNPENLAPAHTSCNAAKKDARPDQWTYTRPSMWLPGFGPNTAEVEDQYAKKQARPLTCIQWLALGVAFWLGAVGFAGMVTLATTALPLNDDTRNTMIGFLMVAYFPAAIVAIGLYARKRSKRG